MTIGLSTIFMTMMHKEGCSLLPILCCVQDLMGVAVAEVTKRLAGPGASLFSRQHLSNMVWALATLEFSPGPVFLQAVAKALIQRAGECNPQEISNAIWAFAKLSEAYF